MTLLSIADFIGRFHPVLVHLPIGILLLACFFHLLAIRKKFDVLQLSVNVILFWGMISAIFSCITGYLLSQSGDYEEVLVSRHQWLGIIAAVISIVFYFMLKRPVRLIITRWTALLLILLIAFTGHLGGSLTHGSGYLTEGLNESNKKGPAIKPIANLQEAKVYASAIQPLFEARCYTCHGPNKMKGKLRLDNPEWIMKGGEDGKAIVPGKTDESLMIERLLLPHDDDDHMPPKEKTQLTTNEIELVHWWIATGADFNKKFSDLPQTSKIKPVLLALESGDAPEEKTPALPAEEVAKPNEKALGAMKEAGIIVTQVAQNSNYLSVNFVTAFSTTDSVIKLLLPIDKQVLWLNLAGRDFDDEAMKAISKLKNITRLNLNNTKVTDKGLAELANLSNLQYLNLVGTPITAGGLSKLQKLKKLKNIYLYHSRVERSDWPALQKNFAGVVLDSGGYTVPTLAKDTTEIKY